jgi:hypothetical protein
MLYYIMGGGIAPPAVGSALTGNEAVVSVRDTGIGIALEPSRL